jgi:hypothetical protein
MHYRKIESLPDDLPLLPWAEEEMRQRPEVERKIFIRRSEQMWVVTDEWNHALLVAGIIQPTQLSTPELWVLLCEGFSNNLRQNLRDAYKHLDKLLEEYEHVMVRVDAEAPAGTKLVELLGFTEYHREASITSREYIYYEVRRGVRSSTRI